MEIKRLTYPRVSFTMESSAVSSYCNEMVIALTTQNVYLDKVFYKREVSGICLAACIG